MAIYWGALAVNGIARSPKAQQEIAAALAALGWVIAAGVAWWTGADQPPTHGDINLEWEDPSWQCCEHPQGGCYPDSGCGGTLE